MLASESYCVNCGERGLCMNFAAVCAQSRWTGSCAKTTRTTTATSRTTSLPTRDAPAGHCEKQSSSRPHVTMVVHTIATSVVIKSLYRSCCHLAILIRKRLEYFYKELV